MIRFLIIVLVSMTTICVAQERPGSIEDRLESRRIAYISDAIQLSPEEAQAFWPVYNGFTKEQKSLKKAYYPEGERDKTSMTLDRVLEYDQKVLDLKKKYTVQIEAIIGSERTVKLLQARRKFQEKMLKGLRERGVKRKRGF